LSESIRSINLTAVSTLRRRPLGEVEIHMKFLSIEQLELFSSFLSGKEIGDRVLNGRIEAFSCKRAGEDKKLSKMLEAQYVDELSQSPSMLGSSPLGPLSESSTRRLLIDLISTMNASFPDHDFSGLRPEQFAKEPHLAMVVSNVNRHLAPISGAGEVNPGFLDELWNSVDQVVRIGECEVYSYVPDLTEDDPFAQGNLWSFNYFFFNKSLKRIIYFTCIAQSKSHDGGVDLSEAEGGYGSDDAGEDGERADIDFMGEMEEY